MYIYIYIMHMLYIYSVVYIYNIHYIYAKRNKNTFFRQSYFGSLENS